MHKGIKMNKGYNPFLPEHEYMPDGEPHVFGDRIYLFASHDKEGGETFCMLDYVVYSAPISDITDWRCDGTIYRADQDPDYAKGRKYLYAPDVVKGHDGRYYLYYAMSGDKGKSGFDGPFRVAVCDEPAGEYQYYGYVKNPDGSVFRRMIPFDPGVINDDGIIRLYYGWSLPINGFRFKPLQMILRQVMQKMFNKTKREIMAEPQGIMGANTVTLAEDMLTVTSESKRIIPGQMDARGTEFEGHAFFEASSIRKIGNTYYFIYSSQKNHEMCYAISQYPDRDFRYGGVILSAGDVGINGREEKERLNTTSNNHGSIECVNGKWYLFYHRHTHKHSYSRQACAEPVSILEDGSIKQVEVTTSGLIGKPLAAKGNYPATIACVLTTGHMPHIVNGATSNKRIPFITHEGNTRYIANIRNGTLIGYRYFSFEGGTTISVMARGNMHGKLYIKTGMEASPVGSIYVHPAAAWQYFSQAIEIQDDSAPLYLAYEGTGSLDLLNIDFQS